MKALPILVFASCVFLSLPVSANDVISSYLHHSYGTGSNEKGYQLVKNEDGGFYTLKATDLNSASIKVFHDVSSERLTVDLGGADKNGDFVGFYEVSDSASVFGGAVYLNGGSIGTLKGDFVENYVSGAKGRGAGIYNLGGTINKIVGDFVANSADSHAGQGHGGAIFSTGKITNIEGNFVGNFARRAGAAIYLEKGTIDNITGDFIANRSDNNAGAIYSYDKGMINNINGNFAANYADGKGGAIYASGGNIGTLNGDFVENFARGSGGAIYIANNNWILDIKGNFIGNGANSNGGAIYNEGSIGKKDETGNIIGGFINSSFIGNYVKSDSNSALGAAIYTSKSLNLFADNAYVQIKDNYTESSNGKDDNAIWIASNSATLNFKLNNNGSLLLDDYIDGVSGYKVNVSGDGTGIFQLYNDIRNADVSIGNLSQLNTINNVAHIYELKSLALNNNIDFVADVDLSLDTPEMDRFVTNNNYSIADGVSLNVIGMNIVKDMNAGTDVAEVMFAEQGLKDNVTFNATQYGELPHQSYQILTPIYKYNAVYDNRDDAGYFIFTRGDKLVQSGGSAGGETNTPPTVTPNGNASNAFNPAVLGSSTGATVGALGTMNTTMHYAFQHAENFMNIPNLERIAIRNRNKYTLLPNGETAGVGTFSPLFTKNEYGSTWFKPYASFESVGLKNGPKVSNITYGSLVGFDTEIESIKGGWDRTITGYIGYNGASQRYSGVDTYQNGGLLGGTVTLYKGNFFNATTLSVGASVASNSTMYGNDNYTMLLGGIGNKTGYNFEFKEGKVILQPSMLMSYTFVNTFDYTNAAGVRIDNKPLHAIQLSPGVKLIGNTKGGWQPYLAVNMVWNVMGKTDATANGVKLPEMSIKPYVQYGVGVQKRIKNHFMGFGQAMIHNGGRNGISLTAGFRWAIGRDKFHYRNQKVEKFDKLDKCEILNKRHYGQVCTDSGRKILKQLTPEQKVVLGGARQNTSKVVYGVKKYN